MSAGRRAGRATDLGRVRTGVVRRLWRGLLWGWTFSLVLTLVVLVRMEMAEVRLSGQDQDLLWRAIAAYWVLGAIIGLVAGGLAGSLSGRWRTALLGFLSIVPMYAGAASVVEPESFFTIDTLVITLVLAALVGPAVALGIRALSGPNGWPVGDEWP